MIQHHHHQHEYGKSFLPPPHLLICLIFNIYESLSWLDSGPCPFSFWGLQRWRLNEWRLYLLSTASLPQIFNANVNIPNPISIWDLKVRIWLNIATEVFYKTSGDGMNGGSVCSPRPLCPRFSKPTTIFFIQFQICKTEHDNAQQRKYLTEYLATWKDALFAIQCITSLF